MTLFQPPEPPPRVPVWQPAGPRAAVPLPLYTPVPQPRDSFRSIDLGFTVGLCALGVLGTIVAVLTAVLLPAALGAASAGFFETSGSARSMTGMLWGHVALLAVTIGCSVVLARRERTVFWLPLGAGVIAAIGYWSVVVGYLLADHSATFVA